MQLFLCGGGSGKQIQETLNQFSKVVDKEKPILYIPLAMETDNYHSCYNWFRKEIKYMNLEKFEMVSSSLELSQKNFEDYSAIFIGGGNTYKLLYNLKEYNNFSKIKEYLEKDGIIFGGSAGAIIFGKNIDGCLLTDENNVHLNDTNGFNCLGEISLLCHLNTKNLQKNTKYLKEYSKNNKLIYLREDTTIYVNDNQVFLLGNQNYIYFDKGQYAKHNFENLKNDIDN